MMVTGRGMADGPFLARVIEWLLDFGDDLVTDTCFQCWASLLENDSYSIIYVSFNKWMRNSGKNPAPSKFKYIY